MWVVAKPLEKVQSIKGMQWESKILSIDVDFYLTRIHMIILTHNRSFALYTGYPFHVYAWWWGADTSQMYL
jgi:hypothetical protein